MYKVCIIGCGMIANSAHIPAYRYFDSDFFICAVCDFNKEIAADTANRHGIPAFYADAEEMLKKEKPDLVSVCAPNFMHGKYTRLAIEYGANVACEKPLAFSGAEAEELFNIAKQKGVFLTVCQTMRFTPDRLAAKRLIDGGKLGDIFYGDITRVRRRGIPTWGKFHIKEYSGGGAFADIGVHMIDAVLWLMGNPKAKSVCATCGKFFASETGTLKESGALTGDVRYKRPFNPDEMDVEDFSSGSILFENNARVNFIVAWASNLPEASDIRLSGTKGGIMIPQNCFIKGVDEISHFENDAMNYAGKPFQGHYYLFDNLRSVLKGKAELIVKPEETINVSKIIGGVYASAEAKKEILLG